MLFRRGARSSAFYLVLEGEVVVFNEEPHDGGRHAFSTLGSGQFTGELNLLNGREALVTAECVRESRLARLPPLEFRRMMAAEPDIAETVLRAFILRRVGFLRYGYGGVNLLGDSHAAETVKLQRFMTRNAYPHLLAATDMPSGAAALLAQYGLADADLPAVVMPGGHVLRRPSIGELADRLGLTEPLDEAEVFDVAVVGAGPAGLAAAVYSASEGLSTIVIEQEAPGGQAGTSSRIENYLGFPTGISGQALAGRAQIQA